MNKLIISWMKFIVMIFLCSVLLMINLICGQPIGNIKNVINMSRKKIGKNILGGSSIGYDPKWEEFKDEMRRKKLEEEMKVKEEQEKQKKQINTSFVNPNQPDEKMLFGVKIDEEDDEFEDDE